MPKVMGVLFILFFVVDEQNPSPPQIIVGPVICTCRGGDRFMSMQVIMEYTNLLMMLIILFIVILFYMVG